MRKLIGSFFLGAAAAICVVQAQGQVQVIANPSVKASDVSKSDLREVFGGSSTKLADGSHVVPVLLKQGPAQAAFLSQIIGKSDAAFNASLRTLVFSGEGTMPKSVDSEAAMVEYVAHTPGAIGYVGSSSPHPGVKVLEVK
jgi:ABC-type phosphate transport system substrate-binding protein